MSSSVGMMTFPYGNIKNVPNHQPDDISIKIYKICSRMHPAIWPSLCNHFFFPRQGSTAGSVLSVPGGICRTTTTPHVSHLSFLSLVVAAVTVATVAAARWCLGSWRCPARARRVSSLGTATHVANHGESHWNSWNILQYCSECWLLEISPSKNQPPSIICWWWYKSNHKLPQRQTQVDTPFVTQIAWLNLIDASILDILTNPTFFCPHQVVEPENLTLDLHKDGKIMQNPSSSVIVRFPNLGQNPTPVSILSIMINVNTMDLYSIMIDIVDIPSHSQMFCTGKLQYKRQLEDIRATRASLRSWVVDLGPPTSL